MASLCFFKLVLAIFEGGDGYVKILLEQLLSQCLLTIGERKT